MTKKNLIVLLTVFLMAGFISACGSSSDKNADADNNKEKVANEENNADESNKDNDDNSDDEDTEKNSEETNDKNNSGNSGNEAPDENSNQDQNTSEDSDDDKSDALNEYSSEEIEYARVWLQLGDTQDIDELNVQHISAGEPLNPDDDTSIDYPEDVVQLTGSRLAEGSITYSSNGDGTIKLYNKIPQRWEGKKPAGEDTYKEILDDTKQESIDRGDDEEVEELIKKINVDS